MAVASLIQSSQTGQYRPFHLAGDSPGNARHLRHTVRGQIENRFRRARGLPPLTVAQAATKAGSGWAPNPASTSWATAGSLSGPGHRICAPSTASSSASSGQCPARGGRVVAATRAGRPCSQWHR